MTQPNGEENRRRRAGCVRRSETGEPKRCVRQCDRPISCRSLESEKNPADQPVNSSIKSVAAPLYTSSCKQISFSSPPKENHPKRHPSRRRAATAEQRGDCPPDLRSFGRLGRRKASASWRSAFRWGSSWGPSSGASALTATGRSEGGGGQFLRGKRRQRRSGVRKKRPRGGSGGN